MARGYLGKISAIVSANTGDYVRKLDDSARRTKAFAQTIQTDLNRASRDSAKALSSMLTPLQRLERAIQNATSQRLKFNGVDTAINSVKQLQAVISRLEGSEIDVAVRTSGLRSLDELKRTLQNLQQEDVDLFVNLVGSEGTVADLRKIRESYREIDGKVVSTNVAVKADVSQVDRLIELFGQFSKQRLDAVINVVGQQQVDKAARSMRQIFSIAEGLAKPLGGAAQQLAGMSLGIQTQFGPALQRAQQEVDALSEAADRGARITRRAYASAAASVESVTAAISRLNEAQSLANSGRTGQELTFRAPRVQDELASSAQVSQQAANLPSALRSDPSVRARIEELARLRQEIAKYQAAVERRTLLNLDTRNVQARLDSTIRKSADVRASLEQTIKIDLDDREAQAKADRLKASIDAFRENLTFSITGEVQNFDQARQELSRLTGAVEQFDVTQRAAFGANLQELGQIVAANDVTKLDRVRELIGQIGEAAGQQKTVNLETTEAQRKTDRLKASLDELRASAEFTITGRPQNLGQVQSELQRVIGTLDKLTDEQQAGANLKIRAVIEAIGENRVEDAIRLVGELRDAAAGDIRLNVDAESAKKAVDALAKQIAATRQDIEFTITGEVQNFDQAKQQFASLNSDVRELEAAQKAAFDVELKVLGRLVDQKDLADLPVVRDLIDRITKRLSERKEFNLDTKQAADEAKKLEQAVLRLRENAEFVITGRSQNIEQVESELQRVLASIGKLKDDARGGLQVEVDAVISAIDAKDFDAARNAVERLRASAGDAITLDADTKAAEEKTKRLQASVDAVRQRVEFSITGNPQTFAQAKQQFNSIFADFEKLGEASKRSIAVDITRVGELIEGGQEGELANIVALLQRVKAGVDGLKGNAVKLDFGLALDDPQRQIEAIRGSIVSLGTQLDRLPASVRSQFIPALQAAQDRLRLIASTADAPAEAIENASNEVDRLGQQLRRVSQVQALPNFAQNLDDSAVRGSIGSLNALQQILNRVGAEAGSNAAVQFDRMRAAIQRATADGTVGSQAFQNELREIARDASVAAAETGRIGQGRAFREIQRGGDVARGGFDKLSLAANQAAFAIDDFFSVQGDFSQRIRGVQNNVTQLAFILGGTRGLFIGLGVAIAAQATVALIKWANGGRTAEDQTKALNDALARQKSLVEELAQAFESLGDSIARRAFSQSGQEARAFAKELEEIAKKQRELREESVASLDPGTQRERAEQNRIQKELEASTNPRDRVRLAAELRRSQQREELTTQAAVNQRAPGIDRLRELVANSAVDEFRANAQRRTGNGRTQEQTVRQAVDGLGDGSDLRATRQALQNRITQLREDPRISGDEALRRSVFELEEALALIDIKLSAAADQLTNSVLRSAQSLSLGIEIAQQDVEDAIRRGVAGAADFQAGLDNTAKQLEAAEKRLAEAQSLRDPVQKDEAVRSAQAEVRDLELRRDAIEEEARNVRLATGRGGARTEAALSALQGNERFANEYGRLTARLRDAVDRETQARRNLDIANQDGSDAAKAKAREELDAATAASDLAAATAEAAIAMEQALARIRKIGDDALRGSEQIADAAQSRFTQDPTAENRRERDAAEQQLIRDRERVARANNALDRARSDAEAADPVVKIINEELEQIRQERNRLGDIAAKDRTPEDARRAEQLANREAALQAEREERLRELTSAEREQQDAIAQEISARQRLIEQLEKERQFDEEVRRRRNPEGDAVRGLGLLDDADQRAARELDQQIADINAAFDELVRAIIDANNGILDAAARQQVDDARRQRDEADRRLREEADPAFQRQRAFDEEVERRRNPQGDALRGLDLAETPGQRAARETEQSILDADAAFRGLGRQLVNQSGGLFDIDAAEQQLLDENEALRQQTLQRIASEQRRAAAPAIFGFADSVENALLQGPSRAALNASDISTQEGARELNRLLRGDDSARDQNLIELQRQSQALDDVNAKLTALGNRVGVAL